VDDAETVPGHFEHWLPSHHMKISTAVLPHHCWLRMHVWIWKNYLRKRFCKHEIYYCHYIISGYPTNKFLSVNIMHEYRLCSRSHTRQIFYFSVLCLFSEHWYFDVNMWSAVLYIEERVYEWLFMHVIQGSWSKCWRQCIFQCHVVLERNMGESRGS
jgi:hypothetical protein